MKSIRDRTQLARDLRQRSTSAEATFWMLVRNRGFLNLKFRRQRPFGGYVLDFFCEELNLVVELDGVQHLDPAYAAVDAERTHFLQSRDLTVVRIGNDELKNDPDAVFARIARIVTELEKIKKKAN